MKTEIVSLKFDDEDIQISTRFRDNGSQLFFFIHGLGCTKEVFNDVFDIKEFDDFSLFTFDLVGFGDSSKPTGFSYSLEDQARICELLLKEFQAQRIHVVGHSMGGSIALLLSDKILEELASFSNIEGNLVGEDCLKSRIVASQPLEEFKTSGFDDLKAELSEVNERGFKLWVQWMKRCDPLAFYNSSRSLVEWSDSGKLLEKFLGLKVKKAYFYGGRDPDKSVLKRLNSINRVKISNSGHFPMNDNPHEFYSKLIQSIQY